MRLIDADEIMKALSIFNDVENGNSHFLNGIKTAKELIEDAPTIATFAESHNTMEVARVTVLPCETLRQALEWMEKKEQKDEAD